MTHQLGSSEKTPIAALHEFCRQNDEVLFDEHIPHETNPKLKSCVVSAFGLESKGSGRSKKEAKHDACAKLIAKLSNLDQFKQKFQKIPTTPRPTSDSDAVIALRNICVQRNWPLPSFQDMQSCGQPHAPIFTHMCQVASIKRTGTFSTKKGAKQIATRAVIDVVQKFIQNEEQMQIATIDAEQAENVDAEALPTYNELKESNAKLWAPRVQDRHNYFLQLPNEDRNEAEKILMDDSTAAKDKVELACAALKLKYKIIDVPKHQDEYKIFSLLGNHDCVIAAKENVLYDRVIDHFKIMLNLQTF